MDLQSDKYYDRLRNIQIGLCWLSTQDLGFHPEAAKAYSAALEPYLTKQLTIGNSDEKVIDAKPFAIKHLSDTLPIVSLTEIEGHINALIPKEEKTKLGLK